MTRWRRVTMLLAATVLAAHTATAKYTLSAGYPWTVSDTGTETASAMAVDYQGFLVVGGNVTRPLANRGRDVLLLVFSLTNPGHPIGATEYDSGYGLDEGPPAIGVKQRGNYPYPPEVYAAFTAPTPTVPAYGLINMSGYFFGAATIYQYADGYPVTGAPALAVSPSGTPYIAGWVTAGGVDQMVTMRVPRATAVTFDYLHGVTATSWSGSTTLSVTGRAIVVEGDGGFRIVAASGGDLWIYRYSSNTYPDPDPQHLKALIVAGYPHKIVTPAWDEPHAAALDGLGYLWIAGSIDNDGAIWRFDPDGNPVPGFPVRFNAGTPSRLNTIAITGDRHAVAAGSGGTDLLVAGCDEAGAVTAGMPVTSHPWSGTASSGNGLVLQSDGSAWIAGTWFRAGGETSIAIWHYQFTPEPPPVAPGDVVVRGPEGGILNLARNETVSILALPRSPGDVHADVLTPRGELVRAFVFPGRGNELAAFTWDGRNAAGEFVASGMYAIRISGGGLAVIRRVVVYRKR